MINDREYIGYGENIYTNNNTDRRCIGEWKV